MVKSRDSARDPLVESEEESGEEEGSSSEEEIEGSESESEPEPEPEPARTQNPQVARKPASVPAPKKPESQPSKALSADSSSGDEESDSETDSDAPIKKPDPNIKPIASKPMDDAQRTPNPKKPRSKSSASGPTSPAKPPASAGTKRPSAAGDGEAKESKRSKKKLETGVESSDEKGVSTEDSKKLFQRLWSEDDEIVILQGMIDYRAKRKADPTADLSAFLEFIKKSIHIDVSKTQLQAKIRRLKKKYENNFDKEKKGKERILKPHEQIAYELSKKIWGEEGNGVDHNIGSPKANGTAVKRSRTKNAVALAQKLDDREDAVREDNSLGDEKRVEGFNSAYIGLGNSAIENLIAKNMAVIKGDKREEMEKKWKKLNVEEIEIFAKKLELMLEQTRSVLEAIKSSDH